MKRKTLYIQPNKSSIAAAKRGLKAREKAPKSKKGGLDALQAHEQGIGSGVLRARDIVAGKRVNAYQVKAFFDRHHQNYLNAKLKGLKPEESRAIQAWLIWGGDPLYRQVKRAVEKDKREREKAKLKKNPDGLGVIGPMEKDFIQPEAVRHTRSTPSTIDLVDARARARLHASFHQPLDASIKQIEVGDHVKVGAGRERVWVKMTGYAGRKYHGIVANGSHKGLPIYFQKKNIMDIMKG